jgi:hypothetical protein
MKRHEIINHLIKKNNYKSYLEIGLDEGNHHNDEKVNCELKHSVDPAENSRATFNMPSDLFFIGNKRKYDIIFIDGLHHCDQVIRDIDNSLQCLNEGGTIVVHDCNPTTEEMQIVPRMQGEWTGDVWKAILYFRSDRFLKIYTIDSDYGVGVIQKATEEDTNFNAFLIGKEDPYQCFSKHKKEILNLITVEEFLAL